MIGFHKMHGLGNNFIFFDEINHDLTKLKEPEVIKLLCDVKQGIGADGLVFLGKPRDLKHDCRMEIYNSDGTEAEMCGNAIRGIGHLFDHLHLGKELIKVETKGGLKEVNYVKVDTGTAFYRAQMGSASFDLVASGELISADKRKPLECKERTFNPIYVNVGNPHAVIFLKAPLKTDEMRAVGAWLETHPNHPRRINIEFVEIISRSEAKVTVWERGCGFTQACGTGATAVTAAGIKEGLLDSNVTIHMPGGDLQIEQDEEGILYMTGPIQEVASGQLSPSLVYQFMGK